ncbi:O-antigen ligase [Streptomyces sp. JJ36]|uniref:O-antigen ligase family protein n=1 Tax=Streptomyces sp. JJ36 TaxID=2736645 RepID=UPI001F2D3888|nr:O-antigen ligase family protein [Streptomyces sp. JJ36]
MPARLARAGPALPVVALVLLLCVPAGAGGGADTRVTVADAASALLVAWCVATLLRTRRRPLTRRAALLFAAPAVAFAVATVTAPEPGEAVLGFVRYLQVFVLVPVAVLLLLRRRRDFRTVAAGIVLLALAQGAFGVWQYLTGTGASYMGQTVRAVGTFGPADVMGMSTVVSYGLLIALGTGLAPPAGAAPRIRAAAFGCAALLLVPLAVSFSRGAWIATGAAALVMVCLAGARTALRALGVLSAAAVVLVGGAGVGGDMLAERLGSITDVTDAPDRSVTDRYALWSAAAGMWREDPVAGVGLKGFPAYRDSHASLGLSSGSDTAGAGEAFRREPLLSPHNMYLLVLGEQGLTGLVLLAGGWVALLAAALARLRGTRRSPVRRGADCGLVAAGLLVWQLTDFLYADIGGPSTVLTAVLFGLAAWWALAPAATGTEPGDGRP